MHLPNISKPSNRQAVGELWAFSLADAHILTRKSGFGKVGAMLNAGGANHIFTINFPMQVVKWEGGHWGASDR